jgi:hypothetical protein
MTCHDPLALARQIGEREASLAQWHVAAAQEATIVLDAKLPG